MCSGVLTGSRHKTRRKQVTGIPQTPVTIGSRTLAALSNALTSKTLVEDVTQEEFVARHLATLEEETTEEPSPHNDLGESCVAEVHWIGKHIPLVSTDTEEHEHLTNHFNEKLNVKILDTFTDLFNNKNVDSIQETYPQNQCIQ